MPALVVFGRAWEIGSDDLVYPGLRDIFFRLPWLIVVCVIYWQNESSLNCSDGEYVWIYLIGTMGILQLILLSDLALVYNSMSGGIMNTGARKWVPLCIYVKFFLQVVEIGWSVIGTIALSKDYFSCETAPDTFSVIEGIIITNWVLTIFFVYHWISHVDTLGYPPNSAPTTYGALQVAVPEGDLPYTKKSARWERKCRMLCCLVGSEGRSRDIQESYKEMAKLLTLIYSKRNLVGSDVFAGNVLAGMRYEAQKRKRIKEMERVNPFSLEKSINFNPVTLNIEPPLTEDWNTIPRIQSMITYSLAIFGNLAATAFAENCIINFCKTIECCNFLPGKNSYPIKVQDDNCCYLKTSGLRAFIGSENLLYASFNNSDFHCPFLIALDPKLKNIVVSVRGSFSCIDFVVDGTAMPISMDYLGLPSHFKAHRGMLLTSKRMKLHIDELKLLRALKIQHPDYTIVFTGISLGAGVATIMSMLYKYEFPDVKCIAFSPPGALLSLEAAEFCNDFVTSMAYGEDVVVRLTIDSLDRSMDEVEAILRKCDTPKYQLKAAMLCALFSKTVNFGTDTETSQSQSEVENSSPNTCITVDSNSESPQEEKLSINEHCPRANYKTKMYPPGRILHFTETTLFKQARKKLSHPRGPRWEVRWADRKEFDKIIISHRMFRDHVPFRLFRALKYFSQFTPRTMEIEPIPEPRMAVESESLDPKSFVQVGLLGSESS